MNIAYIDNQNLYMATTRNPKPWNVDMKRLRVYLQEKYKIDKAYLFMGALIDDSSTVQRYQFFEYCGYELMFRPHSEGVHGLKKGNVDTDIVFKMMLDLYEQNQLDEMFLISGDGDYWRTVEHLLHKGHLGKVILPSHRNASSLYKQLSNKHRVFIDDDSIKRKIELR